MPNFTKKVIKTMSGDLAADEEFKAATHTNPGGTGSRSVGFGVGGVVGGVIADRAGKKRIEEHGDAHRSGMAEDFPSAPVVLALTNKRFLVYSFSQMKGAPKALIAEYPLSDIAAISMEKLKIVYRAVLQFSDGSVVDLDAGRATGAPEFAEMLHQLTGR
ncbi:hypothetical protein HQ535_03550 [bacterium]|nr:hypothetical protein [bacterium]